MIRLVDEFVVSGQSIQSISIRDESRPPTIVNIDGCTHLKLLLLMSDNMTDTQFHHLLSKLPLLEELYLFHCYKLEEIKISNPKLKTLVVSLECQTSLKILEIAAPSLKSFIFTSGVFDPNSCKIKVADCCCSLETLVLFKYFAAEGAIQNLISKFPLLENLWIIGFTELERMSVQNLRLKRLHIAGCLNLKAVEVCSPDLFEFHCTGRESPKFSVADMKASGGLKFEDETSRIWLKRFKRMLINIVGIKDDEILGMIYVE
ncbi:hypothetical protein SLEP1_g9343 [Rubroshorea leprosula]|uniref:At1g61320/AtMIF1 LRR domain-containing protein n=1 Tax=Rubroshorea leprosula TaxID=152421 RepID=A0AAV5IDX6_9ROSI|nr:hypothetical protein SLEP1_g9343 [Rubroshorea leprosula]